MCTLKKNSTYILYLLRQNHQVSHVVILQWLLMLFIEIWKPKKVSEIAVALPSDTAHRHTAGISTVQYCRIVDGRHRGEVLADSCRGSIPMSERLSNVDDEFMYVQWSLTFQSFFLLSLPNISYFWVKRYGRHQALWQRLSCNRACTSPLLYDEACLRERVSCTSMDTILDSPSSASRFGSPSYLWIRSLNYHSKPLFTP